MEKDDEWKGIIGSDYDLEGYGYDARLGRRKSLDPKANQMPGMSGYSFGFNNPNYFIDPDGEFPFGFGKDDGPKRRKKPKLGNNIRGTGLIVLLGGTRGKFFKHNSLHRNNIPKPQPTDNFADNVNPPSRDDNETGKKPFNNDNPLGERLDKAGEDEKIDNSKHFKPEFDEGELETDFTPGQDENGNPIETITEIGIEGKDGKERIISSTTSDKSGNLKGKFKLGKGENIFTRSRIANPKDTDTKGSTGAASATRTKGAKKTEK